MRYGTEIERRVERERQGDSPHAALARKIMEAVGVELPYSSGCIVVLLQNAHITLKGDVEWSYQMRRAVRAATSLRDVACVANEIQIRPHASTEDVWRRIDHLLQGSAAARAGSGESKGLQTGTPPQEYGGRQGTEGNREGAERARLCAWVDHDEGDRGRNRR